MKIKFPNAAETRLVSLRSLDLGSTYRDVRTDDIWLYASGGFVNLTKDSIVTRAANMPDVSAEGSDVCRYVKVECILEIKEG